jgi:hypothetical protein
MGNGFEQRKQKLGHWGFECDCAICEEARASPPVQHERQDLLIKLKPLFGRALDNAALRKALHIIETLEKTYATPAVDVPRIAAWEAQIVLSRAFHQGGDRVNGLKWAFRAMTNLGFVVQGMDTSKTAFSILRWSLVSDYLAHMLMHAKQAFVLLGLPEKAKKAEEYSRLAFKILVGEDASFSKVYR